MCARKLEIKGTIQSSQSLDQNKNYFTLDQGAALQDARSASRTSVPAIYAISQPFSRHPRTVLPLFHLLDGTQLSEYLAVWGLVFQCPEM
jgi:hypothetical protein